MAQIHKVFPSTPTATTTMDLATSKLEPTSQPSQTPASLIVEHDEPANSLSKIDPDLSQLSALFHPLLFLIQNRALIF